jgi:UDP-glucose 4-epimerase
LVDEVTRDRPELSDTTVVVTGARGFLGTALTERLVETGARVIAIDDRGQAESAGVEHIRVNVLDGTALTEMLVDRLGRGAAQAAVIHLAARGHVRSCRDEPRDAIELNVLGTANVLEACRLIGISRVVFPSSALVYKVPALAAIDEDAPVEARTVYAATKLASEALLAAYAAEYGLSCTTARLGNVYGHGAATDSVVSSVVRQALDGRPIVLETLTPVRDFIYRDDVVSALIALAAREQTPGYQLFNVSSGLPTSIRELADVAAMLAGVKDEPRERLSSGGGVADRIVLSIQRITTSTGWIPAFSLEAGLRATMAAAGGSI